VRPVISPDVDTRSRSGRPAIAFVIRPNKLQFNGQQMADVHHCSARESQRVANDLDVTDFVRREILVGSRRQCRRVALAQR